MLVVVYAALWWRDLARRWRWATAGFAIFCVCAIPIVWFGLTPAGQSRLQAVVPLERYKGLALAPYVLGNFLSYFRPDFLLWGSEPTHHHRLEGFAPVLPVMAPLVAAAVVRAIRRPSRGMLFVLAWIVAAPASAALHRESPSSALLLGAIPTWHLLAGAGAAALLGWARAWRRGPVLVGVTVAVSIVLTGAVVGRALYTEYPTYAARDWLYGSRQVIDYLEVERGGYDDVLVSDRLPTPHILLLFYAPVEPAPYQRHPIHVRQPAVRSQGQIGPYQFGRVSELVRQPGRHLVWVGADEGRALFGDRSPRLTVTLPDGGPWYAVYEVERR
jgi:hypothetical protein